MLKARSTLVLLLVLCLVFGMIGPISAEATVVYPVSPAASYYLESYNSYVCAVGNGDVEVWFSVVGVSDMDEIGTLRIMVYESSDNSTWTWKDTYSHEDYPEMLAYDDIFHMSHVTYNGTAGKYYKAYVCIWAGKNGSGDTRYMWTASERAT